MKRDPRFPVSDEDLIKVGSPTGRHQPLPMPQYITPHEGGNPYEVRWGGRRETKWVQWDPAPVTPDADLLRLRSMSPAARLFITRCRQRGILGWDLAETERRILAHCGTGRWNDRLQRYTFTGS